MAGFAVTPEAQVFKLPFCGNKFLSIELPSRYQAVHWQRGDFELFSVAEAGQPGSGAELILYIGHAPSERHPEWASTAKGSIAGQPVEWYSWSEQARGKTVYLSEALLDLFPVEVKRPVLILGKPPAPPSVPPPPLEWKCEEGISVHLLAKGASRKSAMGAAALAATLKKE